MLRATLGQLATRVGEFAGLRPGATAGLLTVAAFGALCGVALFLPEAQLIAVFHDDAFYYSAVARNVAEGAGFTFDRVHATNGFHPLWLGALVPVFGLLDGDTPPLRAILAMQIALVAVATILVFRALVDRIGTGAVVAGLALVALPGSSSVLAGGLESSLVLLILVVTWNRIDRAAGSDDRDLGPWLAIGCLCAAAFLARFEALVVTPACIVLGRRRLRQDLRRTAALLVPPLAAILSFVAWNRAGFGTWLPISGLVKSEWAARGTPWHRLAKVFEVPWVGSDLAEGVLTRAELLTSGAPLSLIPRVALLSGLMALLWRFRRECGAGLRSARAGFPLMVGGAWVAADVVAGLGIEPWNRVPIHLCTAILLGACLSARPRLTAWVSLFLFVAALGRMPWTAWTLGSPGTTYSTYRYQAALWLREQTADDARVGSWNAGLLGYFSRRPVVNLDGLVNDRSYFEQVIIGGDLGGYLRREEIDWLADQACGPDPSLRPYLRRTGSEYLEQEFVLVAAFAHGSAPDRCPGYAVWRRPVL